MTVDSINSSNKYFCLKCKDRNWLIECKCGICGQVRFLRDKRGRIRHFINYHGSPRSQNNPCYKNGRYQHNNYWFLTGFYGYPNANKGGIIAEHIYVYQEYHQCCMLKWGEVHHIDPVREGYCNNMPWNLMGMMSNSHTRYHNLNTKTYKRKNRSHYKCSLCSSDKTYVQKDGIPKWISDRIDGWLCVNCYERIKRKIKKLPNISSYYSTTFDL